MTLTRRILFLLCLVMGLTLPHSGAQAHQLQMSEAWLHADARGEVQLELLLDLERLVTGTGQGDLTAAQYEALFSVQPGLRHGAWEPVRTYFRRAVPLFANGKLLTTEVSFPKIEELPITEPWPVVRGKTVVLLRAPLGAGPQEVGFRPTPDLGIVVLNGYRDGQAAIENLPVQPGETPPTVSVQVTGSGHPDNAASGTAQGNDAWTQTAWRYLLLGFEHIVPLGADHILFVLGLCLYAWRLRPILLQITCFTVAHAVTLALAVLGLVSAPSAVVEPLIALSISAVAIENLVAGGELRKARLAVVFAFGLLHGLGFAGVLSELGLPKGQLATALVAFHVGVEAGQLSVIAAAFGLLGWWSRNKPWGRTWVQVPASVLIAAIGLYWAVDRVMG